MNRASPSAYGQDERFAIVQDRYVTTCRVSRLTRRNALILAIATHLRRHRQGVASKLEVLISVVKRFVLNRLAG